MTSLGRVSAMFTALAGIALAQSGTNGTTSSDPFTSEQMKPHYAANTRCYRAESRTLYKDHCYALADSYASQGILADHVGHGIGNATAGSCIFWFQQGSASENLWGYAGIFNDWIRDYAIPCMENDPSQRYNAATFTLPEYSLTFWLSAAPMTTTGLPPRAAA